MTIEQATKKLLIDSPFYGTILLGMNKIPNKHIPTMCITQYNGAVTIVYNPDFWDSLEDHEEQQYECLKHELMHICLFHPFQITDYPDIYIRNIAADAEVNQYLDINNLPPGCVDIIKWHPDWPQKAGMREYYDRLISNENAVPVSTPNPDSQFADSDKPCNGGNGPGEDNDDSKSPTEQQQQQQQQQQSQATVQEKPDMGNHTGNKNFQCREIINHDWQSIEDATEAQRNLIRNQVEAIVDDAYEAAKSRGWAIPDEMNEIIGKIKAKNKPIFDWKACLRRLVGNADERYNKFTYRRPSKRFPNSRGIEHKRKHRILVALDCSGSVSATEVHEFYSVLCDIEKSGAEIDVIEYDTSITREYKFKNWDGTISGRGGTDWEPAYDYANQRKNKYNLFIMLTDGYCSFPEQKLEIPSIWVISSTGSQQEYPGKTVYIPKEDANNA